MDKLRQVRGRGHRENEHDTVGSSPMLDNNVAFNSKILPESLEGVQGPTQKEKLKNKVDIVKHAIAHPHQSIKQNQQKALLKGLTLSERPWLRDQAKGDEQIWKAHDRLRVAKEQYRQHPEDKPLGVKVTNAEQHVQQLEADREQMEVAWHMGRYVHRARAVQYGLEYPKATSDRYSRLDPVSRKKQSLWMKWTGHLILYGFQDAVVNYIDPSNEVPYDREVLLTVIERLLITTHTYQYWWMRVRHVYRWEDPKLTLKWLALYLVLWYTNYCMTGFWVYLLYSMWSNRHGQATRGWMHNSNIRATDTKKTAATISELIIRHGSDSWFEPFLDEFGPWLQEQFFDLAQFLEISNSFYQWRNVNANYTTSFAYVCLILVSALPDYRFSMKVFWTAVGIFFFMTRPVASLYPRFRHVVNPIRWMFWHQPTLSEYCFGYLRDHAQEAVQKYSSDQSSQDTESSDSLTTTENDDKVYFDCESTLPTAPISVNYPQEPTILTARGHWSSQRGVLELTESSLRFTTHGGRTDVVWCRPLANILEVCKLTIPLTSLPPEALPGITKLTNDTSALSIFWLKAENASLLKTTEEHPDSREICEEETVYGMEKGARDGLFNAILGVGGKRWMELQPRAGVQTRSS